MNLFCFSLEGSMDSLYEAVRDEDAGRVYSVPSRSHSRPCSPAAPLDLTAKWCVSERSVSMDLSQIHTTNSKKKKRKPLVPKSMSDNEVLDNTDCVNAYWQTPKKREDLVHIRNSQNEELGMDLLRASFQRGEDGLHQLNPQRRGTEQTIQVLRSEAWVPSWERPSSTPQAPIPEPRGTQRRTQKSGRSKKGGQGVPEEGRNTFHSNGRPADPMPGDDAAEASCVGLKKGEKRPNTPQQAQENALPSCAPGPGGPLNRQRWSTPGEGPPPWGSSTPYHTCRRPLSEYRTYTCDYTLPRGKDWDRPDSAPYGNTLHRCDLSPPPVARSATDTDLGDLGNSLCNISPGVDKNQTMLQRKPSNISDKAKSSKPKRSTSFGRFDVLKQHPAKTEENSSQPASDGEAGVEVADQHRPGGLGKKMRAISLTMRKKMGRRHAKASFSEDLGEDEADKNHEGEADSSHPTDKDPAKTSNSQESLYSGQSSSSGVTSGSDGSSARDSLRLEEEVPYTGQFCGRARVHTDFVPSPYDSDSLKLKVGDVIDIIRKPPMGIWTGVLNNKMGSFKFIYVDVILEKEVEEPKIRPHRRSKRPRPKTLQELLGRLNLQEYASALLLNGCQTVEDLRDLKEKDLIELNVWNPDHRQRLLAAADCLHYTENDNNNEEEVIPESVSGGPKGDQDECPRDSGCYVTPESSENCKESETEAESQPASPDP
ncbi:uncharacterized protein LOC133107600 [Conger conger]|uniref:uncharacterized protein LOC133107600 n=1 Tax=Conger conger TaxID=82655 RepID=UPI002A59FA81|nr:uncharacterized protein LOC133107600 [Conger conger]